LLILAGASGLAGAQDPSGLLGPEFLGPQRWSLPEVAEQVLPADAAGTVATEAFVEPGASPEPKIWEGSFELGLNGTEGNSQTLTKFHVLTTDLDYHKNSSDSLETANRAFLDWRYERLFDDSPWTWFIHGTLDYDEFQAFDLRVSVDTGLGYGFIKTDATSLLGRLGGGFSHEIGGPDDSYVPEAVFGLDFEHQLSKRQRLTATVDYTPDVTDFCDYRVNTKVGWQVLLDEDWNLSLKVSLLNRYDSTPNGMRPNDIDYAVTLLWSF